MDFHQDKQRCRPSPKMFGHATVVNLWMSELKSRREHQKSRHTRKKSQVMAMQSSGTEGSAIRLTLEMNSSISVLSLSASATLIV